MVELETTLKIENVLDNATNVAEILDEHSLNKIGSAVVTGYDNDRESRSNWEEENDKSMELALQVTEEKTFPWQGAANVKYPLLTTAALQFSSRAYPALIPNSNIVKGRVVGYDLDGQKAERATRIGKHMSYQLIEEMDDWEEEMDKLLLALPILGCIFKKTYYCPTKGINVSEVVYPQDLVINYWTPTIDKASRITHVLELTENDVHERVASGLYREAELRKGDIDKKIEDKTRDIDQPEEDYTTPYVILEQHALLDLDGDGYMEPYIITVHEDSKEVLRITPRFTEQDITPNENGDVIRIDPIEYFTKYGFIPSPDGSIYDLGFGTLLGPMNNTINTLINQLLDAGTMSNLQGGFLSKGVRVAGGKMQFQPNEWKTVNTTGDDLRKGIFPLPVREPSNVLYTLLNTMVTAGERLTSVTEMMTGEIPGQNTKATVAMAAIEQGMKVFNAIHKRLYRAMKKEFRKLYDLNAQYLPLETYFQVLDVGQEGAAQIGVIDYRLGDTDVIPYADPTLATETQRLARIEALGQLLQLGTINPQEYTMRYLEATEQPNIQALMQMPERGPDPEVQLEMMKFQDESARAWAEIEIKAKLAESTMSKEEIESIVALSTAKQKEVKDAVDAIQRENEINVKQRTNGAGASGLETSSTNG